MLERRSRVLVVDDDLEMCGMLREYLSKEQFDVELAHDGDAALQAIAARRPDIVLLDVVELIRQIVHDAEFESQSPPGRLRFTSDESVTLHGDPHVLHAAIDNVVRNALIHGDARMPIKVALLAEATSIQVSVRDHGPGVPDADLTRIFEPFYAPARSIRNMFRSKARELASPSRNAPSRYTADMSSRAMLKGAG